MLTKKDVAKALFSAGIVVFAKEEVTFVSGIKSHLYLNQRNLRSFPKQKALIVKAYLQMMKKLPTPDLLSDVPSGTIPTVSSISDKTKIPQITPRDKPKDHGLGESIIGSFKKGQRVLVFEDTVTTASSILQVVKTLREAKLTVKDVLALVLRNPIGQKNLEKENLKLTYFLTLAELISYGVELGYINKKQFKLAQKELEQLGKIS